MTVIKFLKKKDKFELTIDIRGAQLQRIKPLAIDELLTCLIKKNEISKNLKPTFEKAPDLPDDKIIYYDKVKSKLTQNRLER